MGTTSHPHECALCRICENLRWELECARSRARALSWNLPPFPQLEKEPKSSTCPLCAEYVTGGAMSRIAQAYILRHSIAISLSIA